MADPYDLDRFIAAQSTTFDQALRELAAGAKRSHWMWFVFPQCAGLGSSDMARRYGISSLDEARAFLRHPVLGHRLRLCTAAVNAVSGRTAHDIFGSPDDMKFRSSMTLFSRADPSIPEFGTALTTYFAGEEDARTLEILSQG
ncbi:DUF1810 domain-containing protein [Methylobacterium gnaphalii]|uniref:Calpastatin n=1 Tax=Methylobacterium gnaphalii TaxID=1010610 RepID=A0A512JII4_9HYPH|nr:DUF1810 domain-containing protein [Methylobacterium gnaphalii]GEP09775.1 hypothetical protein MGN01_16200 [Methylobacterium gnaphalii]GJD67309.1 hypothetical protein MMMDOFMJ_0223 [Methylobacterium gnaphalii]GLS49805.1 hypothetical protein GCM10007885_26570 [Methylobacterium gnaphalii]